MSILYLEQNLTLVYTIHSLQWENVTTTLVVAPTTTIGELKSYYMKYSYMDGGCADIVFLRNGVCLEEEKPIANVGFKGPYDFIEVSVPLEPIDDTIWELS